jgi:hypothetical protein
VVLVLYEADEQAVRRLGGRHREVHGDMLRAINDRGRVVSESTFPPADMANVQVHLDAFAGQS